jgi:ketosteroid isomerase-like protein
VNGQPGPFKALWSQREDVTLSGGLGGVIVKGWTQVSERLDWVAAQYTGGVRTHQEVARYVGQDLAYVVLRETIRFKSPADGRAMVQELRVTQVFRREEGGWRIVHRHADSQVVLHRVGPARAPVVGRLGRVWQCILAAHDVARRRSLEA